MIRSTGRRAIDIRTMLAPDRVCDISAGTKDDVLAELCVLAARDKAVTDPGRFLAAIRVREKVMSTGIGSGIAIPHVKLGSVKDFVMAVGRSCEGIDFEALDGKPVHILILIGSPDKRSQDFLGLMARVGALFDRPEMRRRFLDASSHEDIYRLICDEF